jgi:hypothetical protein
VQQIELQKQLERKLNVQALSLIDNQMLYDASVAQADAHHYE